MDTVEEISETITLRQVDTLRYRLIPWIIGGSAFAIIEGLLFALAFYGPIEATFAARLTVFGLLSIVPVVMMLLVLLGLLICSRFEGPVWPLSISLQGDSLVVTTSRTTRRICHLSQCCWYLGDASHVSPAFPRTQCVIVVLPNGGRLAVGWTDQMRERWSRILTARNVSRLPDLGTRRAWNDIAIAGLFVFAGSLLGVAIGIPLAIVLSVVAAKAMQTMVIAYGIAFAVCGATKGLARAAIRRYPVFQTEYVALRLSMVFAASGFVAGAFGGGEPYALASSVVFLVLGVIVGMFVMIKCQKIAA